ncbi:MAG: hypothetical protein IKP31_03030 [Lachnospiraceae bacterium]|nr:hypothetical protein [Lachnospiraceae bacterium]
MIILLYSVSCEFFTSLFDIGSEPFLAVVPAIVIILSYFGRVYIEKLPAFLLVHMLMYAAVIYLPMPFKYRITFFIILTIFFISNVIFWTSGETRSFIIVPPLLLLIFVFVFIYASVKEVWYLGRYAYICGICYLSFYFLRKYLLNGARFASGILINKITPVDEMFKYNLRLVFPLVIGFTTGMFVLQSDMLAKGLSATIRFLADCLGKIIFFLLSLLPKTVEEEQAGAQTAGVFILPHVSSPPAWLVAFLLALEKVVAVFIAGFVIYYAIKMIVRFFRIYFLRHGYDVMTVDREDHTETRERIRHNHRRGIRMLISGLSEQERIRKKYKTAVMRLCRRGHRLIKYHTPAERLIEVSQTLHGRANEGFDELTKNYEKARYFR